MVSYLWITSLRHGAGGVIYWQQVLAAASAYSVGWVRSCRRCWRHVQSTSVVQYCFEAAVVVHTAVRLTEGRSYTVFASIIVIVIFFIISHFITVNCVAAACYAADQRRRETNYRRRHELVARATSSRTPASARSAHSEDSRARTADRLEKESNARMPAATKLIVKGATTGCKCGATSRHRDCRRPSSV